MIPPCSAACIGCPSCMDNVNSLGCARQAAIARRRGRGFDRGGRTARDAGAGGVAKRYGETVALDGHRRRHGGRARSYDPGREWLGQEHAGQAPVRRRPARPRHDPARRAAGPAARSRRCPQHWASPPYSRRCCWRRRAACSTTSSSAMTGSSAERCRGAAARRAGGACPGPVRAHACPIFDARGRRAAARPAAARRPGPRPGPRSAHPDPRRGDRGPRRRPTATSCSTPCASSSPTDAWRCSSRIAWTRCAASRTESPCCAAAASSRRWSGRQVTSERLLRLMIPDARLRVHGAHG